MLSVLFFLSKEEKVARQLINKLIKVEAATKWELIVVCASACMDHVHTTRGRRKTECS